MLKYNIHTADPINHPDKSILQIAKLEVVSSAEVRDIIILSEIKLSFYKILMNKIFSKMALQKLEI